MPLESYVRSPVAGVWGDYDDDGRPDLYFDYGEVDAPATDPPPRRNRVLFGRAGHFTEAADSMLALDGAGMQCAAADFDNNGALDLIVLQPHRGRMRSRYRTFLNTGGRHFAQPAGAGLISADEPGIAAGRSASIGHAR